MANACLCVQVHEYILWALVRICWFQHLPFLLREEKRDNILVGVQSKDIVDGWNWKLVEILTGLPVGWWRVSTPFVTSKINERELSVDLVSSRCSCYYLEYCVRPRRVGIGASLPAGSGTVSVLNQFQYFVAGFYNFFSQSYDLYLKCKDLKIVKRYSNRLKVFAISIVFSPAVSRPRELWVFPYQRVSQILFLNRSQRS